MFANYVKIFQRDRSEVTIVSSRRKPEIERLGKLEGLIVEKDLSTVC